jgi:ABC-type uncharacterized transport system involved in gliding motility auxiliary subunit
MNGKVKGLVALALLAAIIGAVNLILSNLPLRVDMTAEKLYTLSDGSKKVLAKLDEDVTLKFYFSQSSQEMPMAIKTYAQQVKNLIKEYELAGGGRVILEAYDPKPDSDAEEWAQRYGVEQQNVTPFGQGVYFGLVAVCLDREETLPAISPQMESTLEYDITRLITRVAWPERPVIGVMTSLPGVLGQAPNQMMMMQGQRPEPGWAAFSELNKDYDVRAVDTQSDKIDDDIKALVVLHAKNLSEKTLFAIDQFVLRGGRLIACVDSMSVMDLITSRQNQNPMMGAAPSGAPSTLGALFGAWGISFDTSKVTCDMAASTKLGIGQGRAEDNPAFLSLTKANVEKDDLVVSTLTEIMLPFAGALDIKSVEGITVKPLLMTSKDHSCEVPSQSAQFGMGAMASSLVSDGKSRILAARLSGEFKTAYPSGPDFKEGSTNAPPSVIKTGKGAVIVFADSDFLADQFCVRVSNTIFGRVVQPINDNLVLFANIIEQYAGREELIGVRSRGASNRPFVKVDRLEAKAMAEWQQKQVELESALRETQQRLSELQKGKRDGERMLLSREQQDEIVKFRKVQADTRGKLKNVRKELTSDIDALGTILKSINIVCMPLLIAVFGIWYGIRRRRR